MDTLLGRRPSEEAPVVAPAAKTTAQNEIVIDIEESELDVVREHYIQTARAKGVSETVVIVKHALRNAAIPIVTTIALQFGHLIGGSVVTESVFAWPGLGRVVVQAIFQRDAPMVQGGIIIMAVIFTLLNLAVDLVYGKLDPTIRFT